MKRERKQTRELFQKWNREKNDRRVMEENKKSWDDWSQLSQKEKDDWMMKELKKEK